jgi:hypothetical protein
MIMRVEVLDLLGISANKEASCRQEDYIEVIVEPG